MSEETLSKNSETEERDGSTLSELFDKAFELFNAINEAPEQSSSKTQSDIRRTMNMLEDATRLVSIVDMFSKNESFDEVATENLKYFLLPAFLGTLATKVNSTEDRLHILNVAEIYFLDFLKRVKAYGLTDVEIPEPKSEESEDNAPKTYLTNTQTLTEMLTRRNIRLQRYKERKELEARLETLKTDLTNPNIDDEAKREYFVTLVKLYVILAIEELGSLEREKPILEYMKEMGDTETMASQTSRKHKPAGPKLQPVIITRDDMQKKVYGAGYPSLPVLTVQEFYDQRVKEGDWPGPSQRNAVGSKSLQDMANDNGNSATQEDAEDIEKERKIEEDDPEMLDQLRAMDEYKDMHRRGWGNRANRS